MFINILINKIINLILNKMKAQNRNARMIWLTTILVLFTVLNTNAQFGVQEDRDARFINTLGFDPKNAIWGGKKDDNGERRNPPGLAFKGGAFINDGYWEGGLFLNIFQHINYYGMGLSVHKEILTIPLGSEWDSDSGSSLALLVGAEFQIVARYGIDLEGTRWNGLISEYNKEHFNPAISAKVRWDRPLKLPGFIEGEGSYTARYEIKDLWGPESDWQMFKNPGFYIKVGFYFVEIIKGYLRW